MSTLKLSCSCQKVQGTLSNASKNSGNHLTCMCIDCQTFAHYLGRENYILDNYGASEIYQVTPSQIQITQGQEYLTCLRLSPKGTNRWFAKCCNTPVANTISLKMSFAGVSRKFINEDNLDTIVGPIKYQCQNKDCKTKPPKNSHPGFPTLLKLKMLVMLTLGKITKSYLPNPFFKEENGEHINPPIILKKETRTEIRHKIKSL